MLIEDEILKKYRLRKEKLISYGFKEDKNLYKYSKNFMNNEFRADICVLPNGKVSGKVIELELDEEYTNFRMENAIGEFVNTVRAEYIKILEDLAKNCFEKQEFIFDQTNRIANLIYEKYKVSPEFLWEKFPGYGVFRSKKNNKWFGIVTNIDKSKLVLNQAGEIEVINLKLDDKVQEYLSLKGIYPAYHSNKKNWVSVILDDTLKDEEIMNLVDISYNNLLK
jgi:predicted DNA-binding protein (MmcQ/YjbR family)